MQANLKIQTNQHHSHTLPTSINHRLQYFQSQSPNQSHPQSHSKSSQPLSIIASDLSYKQSNSHSQSIAIASRSELKILNCSQLSSHPHSQSQSIKSSKSSNSSKLISIQESFHLNLNSLLGPHYGISNLNFGYSRSIDHLASATTNGAILIWDLNSFSSTQLQPLIKIDHAHSRAINKITFASPIGHWIVTGSQDGLIKLWDIRINNALPQVVITTHSDPVRQLRFHPNRSSDPFTFMSLTDSGTLSHYDLRNGSTKSCMNRRVAHGSVGLGLDWKQTSTENLIASSGTDGIVKIWSIGHDKVLGSSAMKTLVVGRSLKDVVWRPGDGFELVISPTDSVMSDPLMIRSSNSNSNSSSSIHHSSNAFLVDQSASESFDGGRQSEVLVWDIRRERRPEFVLKGQDGSASGLMWFNSKLLITTHKRTGTIVQHDLSKPYPKFFDQLLPIQALSISPTQPMICFSIGSTDQTQISGIKVQGIQNLSVAEEFNYLAQHYKFYGMEFKELCRFNSKVALDCQLFKGAEIWENLGIWFDKEETEESVEGKGEGKEEEGEGEEGFKSPMDLEKGKFKCKPRWVKEAEESKLKDMMKETILKEIKEEIEIHGNLQLGFMVLSVLYLNSLIDFSDPFNKLVSKEYFGRIVASYLRLIKLICGDGIGRIGKEGKRFGSKEVLRCEIRKKFSFKETEEIGLMILKQNLNCGNCNKRLNLGNGFEDQLIRRMMSHPSLNGLVGNSSLTKKKSLVHNRCTNCLKPFLLCSFCHLVVKDEPFRFCGKCGHGIHGKCLEVYRKEIRRFDGLEDSEDGKGKRMVECLTGCGHLDCLKV